MHVTPPSARSRPWRLFGLLVAAVAMASLLLQFGLLLAQDPHEGLMDAMLRFLGFFTILSNIGVAAVCAATERGGPGRVSAWLRRPRMQGAVALCIGVTGLVYGTVLHALWQPQGLQWWADVGLHRAVPVLYLVWRIGGIAHGTLRGRDLAWWLPFPAMYLAWSLFRGAQGHGYPYPFIDAGALGLRQVATNALVVTAVFVVLGALLVAIDRGLGRWRPR